MLSWPSAKMSASIRAGRPATTLAGKRPPSISMLTPSIASRASASAASRSVVAAAGFGLLRVFVSVTARSPCRDSPPKA